MDEMNLIYKFQRELKERIASVEETILQGVDNLEKYQYLIGQRKAYSESLQELSNLLKKGAYDDEQNSGN
jgi:hypothetical protein